MEGGLEYWVRWQTPVCAFMFLVPTLVSIRLIITKNSSPSPTSNLNLWIPCWRNLHPFYLLIYRLFSFISMAYLLYQTVVAFGPFVFYFYTQWTFLLVMIYFGLGTIISAHGCFKDKLYKQEVGFWGNLMQNVYQTCAGAVLLTDIVFWCLLLPFQSGDDFKLTMLIGLMHSVNVGFLLVDSAVNNLQFSWHGLTYFVLWSSTYVVFQWVLHACCFTWWPYPFLEVATPWAPMWYFGIALFHIPCYGLYVWLLKAKVSIFSKMFPHAFIKEKQN